MSACPALLSNAITDALREMEKCPNDDVQTIWNEKLTEWQTGYRMTNDFVLEVVEP